MLFNNAVSLCVEIKFTLGYPFILPFFISSNFLYFLRALKFDFVCHSYLANMSNVTSTSLMKAISTNLYTTLCYNGDCRVTVMQFKRNPSSCTFRRQAQEMPIHAKSASLDTFRSLHRDLWARSDLTQMPSRARASPSVAGVSHQTRRARRDSSQPTAWTGSLWDRDHPVPTTVLTPTFPCSSRAAVWPFCRLSSLVTKRNSCFCTALHSSCKSSSSIRACRVQLPAAWTPHSQRHASGLQALPPLLTSRG